MLDIKFLRENLDFVRRKILERGQEIDLDRFAALEAKRRNILQEVESLRSERNQASKEIGRKKAGKEDASGLIARMAEVSARIKELDELLKQTKRAAQFRDDHPQHPPRVRRYGTSSEETLIRTWAKGRL
jgi:seryl-tRNA synthetase